MEESIEGFDSNLDCIEFDKVVVEDDKTLKIGSCFSDAKSFKHSLRSIAILNNFSVKIEVSNRLRVVAVCSYDGCPWRVRAALCADGKTYEVRKLEDTHLCPGVNRTGNRQATTSWVANEIEALVKKNPDISPKQLKDSLENMYGLSLPYMKLWRAREEARDNIFGSIDGSYLLVPSLKDELLSRNPGSHILYLCDSNDSAFKRFFVSFKVSIDGFLAGCRHLIGLDACHLKSKYLGVLLSANSLDGNNGLFTLAFAVAEGESRSSWQWFLENLAASIEFSSSQLSFISDMEKGLGDALKNVFPEAEHRVCLRHLWKNLKKHIRFDSCRIQNLFWNAANTLLKSTYKDKMVELYTISPQIHQYLISLPYKWSRSDYSCEIKNYYNTNNMSESFNSWIREARSKPAVELIDTIRAMLMEQRSQRKCSSDGWTGVLVPYAEEYIRDITTRKDQLIIRQATQILAEVEGHHERHVIDIEKKECSCRFWQMTGLPCLHAAAFISSKNQPLWHLYVDDSYHVVRYRMAYEGYISTLPGKEQWCSMSNSLRVTVPNTMRPRGRPKKRRIQNFLEGTSQKKRGVHQCGRCGLWGHHQNTCKNPLSQNDVDNIQVQSSRKKIPFIRDKSLM